MINYLIKCAYCDFSEILDADGLAEYVEFEECSKCSGNKKVKCVNCGLVVNTIQIYLPDPEPGVFDGY